jgi:hypothetical protein
MIYVDYMIDANYVGEAPPIIFLQETIDYEEDIK